MVRLCVLDDVTWEGAPVPGERTHSLLRSLVEAGPRGAGESTLVDEIWGDELPANPGKALQVVVSRARSATASTAIERTAVGYRLALGEEDVDAWSLRPLGLRLAAEGRYDEALPLLDRATPDEEVTAAALRATAAVHGVPDALERYEHYRADLADRLGIDPSPRLQALHGELLASDRPVREGVHHYASSLIGRGDDLTSLRTLLRSHRVVSILGPGGLGKTRLAQLAAAAADQPVVRVVELVGVVDPEDLLGEVGSVLGVRDSVSGRRALTPEQRRDVRTRIAQQLDQAPTLLVLDNCEHLIRAVADLVAFLVTAAPQLRVLTTTRTPLAIAAERVFPLGTLSADDAAELFRQRAEAARPGVTLPDEHVASIVARLDGLPLAIELAAVKVRAMSVADVDARLANRFALLRGGDRSAPDRHQTLIAVIDWSWNLLQPQEQRALRWLSVFHDGFTIDAAERLLGIEAFTSVERLIDHSLITVTEPGDTVRYRMLETIREFGRMQLVDAGEYDEAVAAQRAWAVELCRSEGLLLFTRRQVEGVGAIRAEDGNLTDVLRRAIADGDSAGVVLIYSTLGGFWAIVGDHPRAFSIAGAVVEALADWQPPAELVEQTRITLASCLLGATLASTADATTLRTLVERVGTDSPVPELRTTLRILLAVGDVDHADGPDPGLLAGLTDDPDPGVRATAYHFLSHHLENAGAPQGAIDAAARALDLVDPDHGPWLAGILHAQLCGMHSQLGDVAGAARHAALALPVLRSLGAIDDVLQIESVLAMAELEKGDVDAAERMVDELADLGVQGPFGSRGAVLTMRGEVLLARGRTSEGLVCFRESVDVMRQMGFPGVTWETDLLPWVLFAESVALATYARHGEGDDGADLSDELRRKAGEILVHEGPMLDFPVFGVVLFSTGLWGLLRGTLPAEDAVQLLVVADGFSYHRFSPAMRWETAVADAERIAPGLLAEIQEKHAGRRGADLLDDARRLVMRLF